MRRSLIARIATFALMVIFVSGALIQAQSKVLPSRVVGAITDELVTRMPGAIHPLVKRAVDKGRLSSEIMLSNLSLNFVPSTAQRADLESLLAAQQNPSSSSFHQWLTPVQYGERFGMSPEDLVRIAAWLTSRGFTVERTAPSNNAIHFSGTAGQVELAFRTELHSLLLNGEPHFANTIAPSLPTAFASSTGALLGLNDFSLHSHAHVSARMVSSTKPLQKPAPEAIPFTSNGGSPPIEYISPEDFSNIYNVKALYNAGFTGSPSYPIGIIGQTGIYLNDISDFRTQFGLPTNLPTLVLAPNTGGSGVRVDSSNIPTDLAEADLDLELSGAVARNAPVYYIYAGNATIVQNGVSEYAYGVFDALQYAIQDYTVGGKPIPILSLSYGECEANLLLSNYATLEAFFQQANMQGQTILNSSGDSGAAGCDYSTTAANNYDATHGLAVSYPASSPSVTAVGGTSFVGDLTSQATYWGSNDTLLGNELGIYIPSMSWNDTPSQAAINALPGEHISQGVIASGGGVSAIFAKPSWQLGVPGATGDGKRDVPDLSLTSDIAHDPYLFCTNLHCEGQNLPSGVTGDQLNLVGGTSAAAPSLAGILALAEQKLASAQGNINLALYAIARSATTYASAFHDITSGSNIVPCVVSATDIGCVGGLLGYNATTGYDLVTGLGDVDATNLVSALGGTSALISTTETLSFNPSAPVAGQAVTFTASIAHATGTIAPTGPVVFMVDNAATGTTIALSPTGTAIFSQTFTTAGLHSVIATYAGDANYFGSTATASATVTIAASPTNAATVTTLSAAPSSIAAGSMLTLTATVSSTVAGTLAGTVSFSSAAGPLCSPTLAPLCPSLTVSGTGTSGTATLVVPVALATLPVGTDTVTASFLGGGTDTSGGFYLRSSGTSSVTVSNPTITVSATNFTVSSGGSGSSKITVTSAGGYAGTVSLSASSAALNGSYSGASPFTPMSLTLAAGGSATSVFTLSSITGSAKSGGTASFTRSGGVSALAVGGTTFFAGLMLLGVPSKRRRRAVPFLLSLLILATLGGALGCSSSSSPAPAKTGAYSVMVVATDSTNNAITATTTFTVTVQ